MTTSISSFFSSTLGTPLVNSRWSWGAQDVRRGLVALRIWEAEIERDERGERVLVLLDDVRAGTPGHNERLRHIEALRRGARGIGIVCARRANGGIRSFDAREFLELGELERNGTATYALSPNADQSLN